MKRGFNIAGAVIGALVGALLIYGVLIEPRLILDERRYEIAIPNLDPEWDGAEVALFSDMQVGMWFANTGMIERIVERTVEVNPAAVLIAGDFVYSHDPTNQKKIDTVVELISPITEAGIPIFAILGNHDYIVGAEEELTAALESLGVTVLLNETAEIPSVAGAPLHVVGLGPAYENLADADKALNGLNSDEARVVFMHNPDTFRALPANSAPLAVAGHTHCGQIAVPGTPEWSWLALTRGKPTVADGFAPTGYGASGNQLYVNCGIGFSDIPVRISAPPQLAFFKLTAETANN